MGVSNKKQNALLISKIMMLGIVPSSFFTSTTDKLIKNTLARDNMPERQ